MKIEKCNIDGLYIIKPTIFGDERGYFCETYKKDLFEKEIGPIQWVQENQSKSTKGVLRGLHFQKGDKSQAKLVSVVKGRVFDVAVDLRKESPTFGKYFTIELTEDNLFQLFIPRGFAHGFLVLSEDAIFQYKVDNEYSPRDEGSLKWDDKTVNINWPEMDKYHLSEKDLLAPELGDYVF